MTRLQEVLRDLILTGLRLPECEEAKGELDWLLANLVAKYSNAADHFRISVAAEDILQKELKGGLTPPLTRHHFKGGKHRRYVCEHPVPVNRSVQELLSLSQADTVLSFVTEILDWPGPTCILLREEDTTLRKAGLRDQMPSGWSWGSTRYARYDHVGIRLSRTTIAVSGRVYR